MPRKDTIAIAILTIIFGGQVALMIYDAIRGIL